MVASVEGALALDGLSVPRLSLKRVVGSRRLAWAAYAALLCLAAALLTLNPPGYFGGHWDDGRYLDAALAWVQHGPQLGPDHWSLRWPIVLPTAAAVELFGATRIAAMLPGLIAFMLMLTVNFWGANRIFGTGVAAVATFALICNGEIIMAATRLTADLPELLFWSAGGWAFAIACGTEGRLRARWLIAAGAMAGLAWATRETSLSLLLIFATLFVVRLGPPRSAYVWIAAGFAAVALPELILLHAASGDWLYRLHTDLHHIDIPSDNMVGSTAPNAFAPLNASVAERWTGVGPVRLYWAIDPWINLFCNVRYGLSFLLAGFALLGLAVTRFRGRPTGGWRLTGWLTVFAAIHVVTIVYIIATDPKPRMFMPSIAVACLVLALAAMTMWHHVAARRWLAGGATIKLILVLGAIDFAGCFNNKYNDLVAEAAQLTTGKLHVDRWTLSRLALAPAALQSRLTTAPPQPGDLFITTGSVKDARDDPKPSLDVEGKPVMQIVGTQEPMTIRLLQRLDGKTDAKQPSFDMRPIVTVYRHARD